MPLVHTAQAEVEGGFSDPVTVWQAFLELVNELPLTTVLATAHHQFPGGGLSGIVIVGESHAAIHTWPELGLAWAELATCSGTEPLAVFLQGLERLGRVVGIP